MPDKHFEQSALGTYVLTGAAAALFTAGGIYLEQWWYLVAIPVALLICWFFGPVTLDVAPTYVTVAFRGRYCKRSFAIAEIESCTTTRHFGNLGYRVGLFTTHWASSWGSAVKFRAGKRTCVVGCDDAAAACADILFYKGSMLSESMEAEATAPLT